MKITTFPTPLTHYKAVQKRMQGAVFLEFVITMMALIPITFATIEVSHAISQYKIIANQTRAAARYLMTQAPGDAQQRTYAKCLVMTSTLDCTGSYLLAGLKDPAMISIYDSTDADPNSTLLLKGVRTSTNANDQASMINLIEVKVQGYKHNLGLGWTNITFSPIRTVMRQIT